MNLARQAQLNDATTRSMKPIRLIPVAEAWYNVDQAIKAGKFAGTNIKSMTDFYVDASHPSNAGAYLIALTFYSSLTGKDPRGVAPTSHYMNTTLADTRVQQLLQQAVYDAMTYSGYAGWTTPIASAPAATGSLRMTVFDDIDRDGVRDGGEPTWANAKVFLDADNDGVLDVGEKSGTTNMYGQAIFSKLAAGPTYRVRVIPPAGTTTTSANPSLATVSANTTKDLRTGLRRLTSVPALGSIAGRVFSANDKDGWLDNGEQLLAGRTVFLDADNDNVLDATETRVSSDAAGNFKFTGLAAGTYRVKRVFPSGYRLSTPAATVTLSAGQSFSGVLIGAAQV